MHKSYFLYLLQLACLLCSFLHAESNLNYQTSNRAYLGYTSANLQVDDHLGPIQIKGSERFYGGNLGYEYLTPDAFYLAVKADMIWSVSNAYSVSYKDMHFATIRNPKLNHVDLEFGYAKPYGNWLFTPYAGIGYSLLKSNNDNMQFKSLIDFSSYGIRTEYYFEPSCSVGLNIKFFRSFHTRKEFVSEELGAKMYWETPGIYVSLPVIYRLGECKKWNIQIEPYYTSLTRYNKQEAFGANLNLGISF